MAKADCGLRNIDIAWYFISALFQLERYLLDLQIMNMPSSLLLFSGNDVGYQYWLICLFKTIKLASLQGAGDGRDGEVNNQQ